MRIDRIKLATEMMKQDMSQRKLSELSGISRMTINSVRGGKSCSEETGNKIAAALNVPIEKLLEK